MTRQGSGSAQTVWTSSDDLEERPPLRSFPEEPLWPVERGDLAVVAAFSQSKDSRVGCAERQALHTPT